MLEGIFNMIFSIPYLSFGVLVAVLLDVSIFYTKSSERLTFLEIWGCVMFWPFIVTAFLIGFIKGDD